ncbi:MAG: cell division ATP-binding protein FtsE, partial [Bacteroidota bacterium]
MNTPVIDLNDVVVAHENQVVLNNVSLKIFKGDFVYLIGKTGSGKSSLLQMLYGELPVKSGTADVVGFNMNMIKSKMIPDLRRKIGIIFQDFQLLTDRSVEQNLVFYLKATGWKSNADIKVRVGEVLHKVGLSNKGNVLPNGLSGGEQQRLAIARALLNDPELIIADEPTGNLDPDSSNEIMKLLFEVANSNRAVLMVTHNYTIIDRFPA